MKNKLLFILFAIFLLTPWPVAYAYDNAAAGAGAIQIEPAVPSATPTWKVFINAIGGVTTPGDLFYLNMANSGADTLVTLHIINADELIRHYRYLILNVGVYVRNESGQWTRAIESNGEMLPDKYITLQNGNVSFTLPGYAQYKITIDSGSFYCFKGGTGDGGIAPKFYLTAE